MGAFPVLCDKYGFLRINCDPHLRTLVMFVLEVEELWGRDGSYTNLKLNEPFTRSVGFL